MTFITVAVFVYIGLEVKVQNILSSLYLVISAFLSAMLPLPIMGIINRIKNETTFTNGQTYFFGCLYFSGIL